MEVGTWIWFYLSEKKINHNSKLTHMEVEDKNL